jgi:hypothetical protein
MLDVESMQLLEYRYLQLAVLDGCFDVCVLLYDWCVAACEPDAGNDVEQLGSVFEKVIRNASAITAGARRGLDELRG